MVDIKFSQLLYSHEYGAVDSSLVMVNTINEMEYSAIKQQIVLELFERGIHDLEKCSWI
ncbi:MULTISPECIES: hypothetical protein [Photorhabdus]|uniref:hypothetical protein n=1 Tax=Photorhabdus TaxID=29487 RepID=UPI001E29F3B8|nr:hypothetical protein [Photorhabdus thracensis]